MVQAMNYKAISNGKNTILVALVNIRNVPAATPMAAPMRRPISKE
jgi:transposase-like protein